MQIRISHTTRYLYDAPIRYALQRVRVVPLEGPGQRTLNWDLDVRGATEEVRYADHFGNDTRLFSVEAGASEIVIIARGAVETTDTAGVIGMQYGHAPLWLFLRHTPLTSAGEGVAELLGNLAATDPLDRMHELMRLTGERVTYETGATSVATTAEDAISRGAGVCQDHTHVFLAASRALGVPARYVSGYLLLDAEGQQAAMHAWAEAHVEGLGWVGFDAANGICPDGRYVRVAAGLDYRDAMPVSGILSGQAREELAVHISVEQ